MSLNPNSPEGDPINNRHLLELLQRISNAELDKGSINYNYNHVILLASKAVKSIEAAIPELSDSDRLELWKFFQCGEVKITPPK